MPELVVNITLAIDTALSVGAGGSGGVLADKTIVRNRLNQLVLPGSHLKGRLRHACEVVAKAEGLPVCDSPRAATMCPQLARITNPPCPICTLFGSPAWPSPLQFADLIYEQPIETPAIRPGASINRRRRTVEEQRLFFTETSPPGAPVYFHCDQAIHGWLPDDQRAEAQTRLLLAGLALIQSWGGGKSRGLGWGHVAYQAQLDGQEVRLEGLKAVLGGLR